MNRLRPTPAQSAVLLEMARGSEVYYHRNEWRSIGPRWVNPRPKARAGRIRASTWRALVKRNLVELRDPTANRWGLTLSGSEVTESIEPEDLIREPKTMIAHDMLKGLRQLWPDMPMALEVAFGPNSAVTSFADVLFLMGTQGMTAIEIKVSRGDWLSELKNPKKRAPIVNASARFYFATPTGLTLPEELPKGCGLIEIDPQYLKATVVTGSAHNRAASPDWLQTMRIANGIARAKDMGL